ncbi:MAG TPA: DHH family phosphoesterase [Candidatus Paceibacterota bacterium]|nr:DHH family phosphoesterase [Candidatus Paceibacterota bacterium]
MPEEIIKINGTETEKVSTVLRTSKKKRVAIFCHDSPDPDCIASAEGFRHIAKKFKKEVQVYYGGEINHIQNRALCNVFDISMINISDLDERQIEAHSEMLKESIIVVLDTSMFLFGNCQGPKILMEQNVEPDIIIDHHNYDISVNDKVTFIKKQTGSCSSIIFMILKQLKVKMNERLKTILFLGLLKDTDDFKHKDIITNVDIDVYNALKNNIDFQKYLRVTNCPKPMALIELKAKAFNKYIKQTGNCIVCGVGFIPPSQRALLAEICDDLMQYDEVEKSMVLGIVDEGFGLSKYFVSSFRSGGDTVDAHEFVRKIFGKDGAGGRRGASGSSVLLDDIAKHTIDRFSENVEKKESYFNLLYQAYSDRILQEIKM